MSKENGHEIGADGRRDAAIRVALRTGLLMRCLAHGEVYDPGQHDVQGACMVASYLVNLGDPLVAAFEDDRGALLAHLRTICANYGPSCSQCASPTEG